METGNAASSTNMGFRFIDNVYLPATTHCISLPLLHQDGRTTSALDMTYNIQRKTCQGLYQRWWDGYGAWLVTAHQNSLEASCSSQKVPPLQLSLPNRRTYRLEFCLGGQVEEYLGQVWRSWVKGQDHQVKKCFNGYFNVLSPCALRRFVVPDKEAGKRPQENDLGCTQSACSLIIP